MSDPITQTLDAMQARCDGTSPGPWRVTLSAPCLLQVTSSAGWDVASCGDELEAHSSEDAHLIAASRTDIPKLIAALRAIFEQIIDPGPTDEYDTGFEEGERQGYHDALCDVRAVITEALGVQP